MNCQKTPSNSRILLRIVIRIVLIPIHFNFLFLISCNSHDVFRTLFRILSSKTKMYVSYMQLYIHLWSFRVKFSFWFILFSTSEKWKCLTIILNCCMTLSRLQANFEDITMEDSFLTSPNRFICFSSLNSTTYWIEFFLELNQSSELSKVNFHRCKVYIYIKYTSAPI